MNFNFAIMIAILLLILSRRPTNLRPGTQGGCR